MKKQPEQTEQTKRNITDAFWLLAKDEGISGVSVSSVMKKAGYNRGTFYVYFTDIPDLVEQTEQELLDEFSDRIKSINITDIAFQLDAAIAEMIHKVNTLGDRVYILLGKGGDPNFLSKARKKMIEMFPLPIPDKEYVIAFVTSALVGTMTYWYESGKTTPLEQVIGVTHRLITQGILQK